MESIKPVQKFNLSSIEFRIIYLAAFQHRVEVLEFMGDPLAFLTAVLFRGLVNFFKNPQQALEGKQQNIVY